MNRALIIEDKYLGREVDGFMLKSLTEPMLGNDAFSEVYFKTESGNMYLIHEFPNEFGGRGNWVLRNTEDWKKVITLFEQDIEDGQLETGKPFEYGLGGHTTIVTQIICVNTRKEYILRAFQDNECDVRNDFAKKAIGLFP